MQQSDREDFRAIVIEACRHVLPQCDLPIAEDPQKLEAFVERSEQLAAFIGFSADALRGSVIMLVPLELVRLSYPLPLKSGIEGHLELFDWCGEIVNRLLGRIKAGLAVRGVEVEPSTPKTMLGEQLQFMITEPSNVCALRFDCRASRLAVVVDAVSSSEDVLFRAPDGALTSQPEGALLFL